MYWLDQYKKKARRVLQTAVKLKRVVKPSNCQRCGCATDKDKLHGHHANYGKPLDVEWLCWPCHCDEHGGGIGMRDTRLVQRGLLARSAVSTPPARHGAHTPTPATAGQATAVPAALHARPWPRARGWVTTNCKRRKCLAAERLTMELNVAVCAQRALDTGSPLWYDGHVAGGRGDVRSVGNSTQYFLGGVDCVPHRRRGSLQGEVMTTIFDAMVEGTNGKYNAKLTREQVCAAYAMRVLGLTAASIGKHFGVHPRTVGKMYNDRHKGYSYAYKEFEKMGRDNFLNKYLTEELVTAVKDSK